MAKPKPKAKTLKQMYGKKTEQATTALSEFTTRSTLGLAFVLPGGGSIRSGLYVTLGGKYFIVTAWHGLANANLEHFTYQPRPAYKWGKTKTPKNMAWPDNKAPAPIGTVIKRGFLGDPQDLLVMQIEPLPTRGGWIAPYDLERCPAATPPIGSKTLVVGCIGEFMEERYSEELGRNEYLLKPLHLWTHVVEEPQFLAGCDSAYHFLLKYNMAQDDPMHGVSAHGMSGGAVFQLPPKCHTIVVAHEMLLGVQHFQYTNLKMLRVTRIEHAVQLVREVLNKP